MCESLSKPTNTSNTNRNFLCGQLLFFCLGNLDKYSHFCIFDANINYGINSNKN